MTLNPQKKERIFNDPDGNSYFKHDAILGAITYSAITIFVTILGCLMTGDSILPVPALTIAVVLIMAIVGAITGALTGYMYRSGWFK